MDLQLNLCEHNNLLFTFTIQLHSLVMETKDLYIANSMVSSHFIQPLCSLMATTYLPHKHPLSLPAVVLHLLVILLPL